jgi:Flp pilus assembly protein TadD
VALAAGAAAYLAHSLIDMGWEYVAVSVPLFLSLGVLLSAGRETRREPARRPLAAAGTVVLAVALVASLASPWLADRWVEDAFSALERGNTEAAARSAKRAADVNPLSIEPLHAQALAAEVLGDRTEAKRLYVEAVELQPRNPATWLELGRFTFRVERDPDTAFRYLDNAYALDRYGEAGPLLDQVREALEERGSG